MKKSFYENVRENTIALERAQNKQRTRLIFALILNDTDSIGGLPQAKKVADAAAAVISDRAPKPSPSPSDSSHSAGEHSPSESAKPAESPKATDTSTSNAPVTLAPAGEPAPTEGK